LESELQRAKEGPAPAAEPGESPAAESGDAPAPSSPVGARGALATTPQQPPKAETSIIKGVMGTYEQGRGFGFIRNEFGEVNFGIYTYLRYLNQKGLEDKFTNGLGQRVKIDDRDDLELNKVKIEFRGWIIDPHFRYVLYTWTNQAAQGLGAQVVVGGNLNWV